MTKLSNDTVLRLAEEVDARIMRDHETQNEFLFFSVGAVHKFAALIQAEMEKSVQSLGQVRQAFEESIEEIGAERYPMNHRLADTYIDSHTQSCWQNWLASARFYGAVK